MTQKVDDISVVEYALGACCHQGYTITVGIVVGRVGCSVYRARRVLKRLVAVGLLRRHGSTYVGCFKMSQIGRS